MQGVRHRHRRARRFVDVAHDLGRRGTISGQWLIIDYWASSRECKVV